MRIPLWLFFALLALMVGALSLGISLPLTKRAQADFAFTVGSGTNAVGFDGTHSGTGRCTGANNVCFGFVPMDTTGTASLTTANPGVVTQAPNVTPNNCSGTITVGGTAQSVVSAGAGVHGLMIANLSATDTLWVAFNGTAAANTAGSYPLLPLTTSGGGSFVSPVGFGTNAGVSLVGPVTTDPFSCTWW